MVTQSSNNTHLEKLNSLDSSKQESNTTAAVEDNRQTKTRVRVRIPKAYHEEPVISRLVSHHNVTVNINGALLGANARDDGWFDLELRGTRHQLQSALTYLNELDLEMWGLSNSEEDGW